MAMGVDQRGPYRRPQSLRHKGFGLLLLSLLLSLLLHGTFWWLSQRQEMAPETLPKPKAPIDVLLLPAPSSGPPAASPEPSPPKPNVTVAPPKPQPPKRVPSSEPTKKPPPKKPLEEDPNRFVPSKPKVTKPQEAPVSPLERPTQEKSEAPKTASETDARPKESAPSNAASKSSATPKDQTAGSGAYEGPKANAAYLHNPKPLYPAMAKRRQWEGKVILKVKVLASGAASEVSIQTPSGHEILDEAALEAVRQWHFVPAKRGGQPVDSLVNVPINFNLLETP
ncbi:MAG: energy transducer TonB [Gammaproteobacteria bacterium]|nr:energy transducer TonB [Gammaproteobacteria bacterium]